METIKTADYGYVRLYGYRLKSVTALEALRDVLCKPTTILRGRWTEAAIAVLYK